MADVFENSGTILRFRIPLVLTVVMILSMFIWANTSEIHQQVYATGRVIPSGKARKVQHLEGGIIREIKVKEGDIVNAGAELFLMSNQTARSRLGEIQVSLKALEIKRERLVAERDNRNVFNVDSRLFRDYPNIVQSEQELFYARRGEIKERLSGMNDRLRQKSFRLDELNLEAYNLQNELDVAKEQLEIKERLNQTGATSKTEYLNTKSRVFTLITRLSNVEKEKPTVESERDEIEKDIALEKEKYKSEVLKDLRDTDLEIKQLRERQKGMEDEVDRMVVVSPIKGIVAKLDVNTIGQVVQGGQQMAEIVPVEEKLVVEGRVTTNNRGKIWPGLPVIAKITAYDYTIYGGLEGTLEHISADSTIEDQQEFYTIRVVLDNQQIGEDKPVHPGMTVDLNILTEKISVLHAIMRPFLRLKDNALRDG